MADRKLSASAALTGATLDALDLIYVAETARLRSSVIVQRSEILLLLLGHYIKEHG